MIKAELEEADYLYAQAPYAALAQNGGPVKIRSIATAVILFLASVTVFAGTPGTVYPDPESACPDFKAHELCFKKPVSNAARTEYLSTPFYAVILKTAQPCTITEEVRLETQTLFPQSKVFSTRFYCDENIEENISYTNINDQFGFLAVHAGTSLKEANQRLAEVKALGRFPGANIRKMQVKLVSP